MPPEISRCLFDDDDVLFASLIAQVIVISRGEDTFLVPHNRSFIDSYFNCLRSDVTER